MLFHKAGQDFFECSACAFQFGRSETNANFAQSFGDYEPAYQQYLDSSSVDVANHEALIEWIESSATLVDPGVALLDVGAGSGKFLRFVRARRQCRAMGIEPSDALFRAFDLSRLGVANLTLPSFSESANHDSFDVVTVLDVLEHVIDPLEFGDCLYRLTKPGGYVFVSTPDVGSFVARMLGQRWHHYNRYHFSLFDARSIGRLARAAGFVVVGVEHRGKRFASGYVRDYVRDFLRPSRGHRRAAAGGRDWVFSLNLFDIMSVVWRKPL
jgi:2-polyprenyl-3-methyl-5-hydroxy-6-metoxy-1,4-benzoquinol methylase